MKYCLALFLVISSLSSNAQEIIEACKFGQPLLDALQDSYTPSNPLGYGPARDILYSEIDNIGNDLSGIYTGFTVTLDPNEDPSVSAFQNGDGINAEHVYPQSLGAGDEPARSDLHNIFPSKVNVNSSRGNCQYNEISDTDTELWFYLGSQTSNTPTDNIDLYSEKDEEDCFFEPRESVKGDIARAMFYFYAIYQSTADAINPNYLSSQKDVLYQWHLSDPVDVVERERDSLIALQQGNRNPFILDNSLVERAYFMADASYPEGDPNCFSATTSYSELYDPENFNIASNFVESELIIYSKEDQGTVLIYDLQGRAISKNDLSLETRLSVSDLTSGIYILYIQAANSETVLRFYKQ